ncbi:MAG: sigma-70 family RNA polymerase sigma factor [Oligoflexales bacterium]|nr:sigma-70 family RNA polymerase sigma factor [Oligoflexales bacterium]
MSKTKFPWKGFKGQLLPTSQLKAKTKSWDRVTWENYLQEEVESGRTECLLDDPWKIDQYATSFGDIAKESIDVEKLQAFTKKLGAFLVQLTEKEQRIIFLIFWKGLSQREIASLLKLNRSTIKNTRDRAFRKLGNAWIKEMLQKKGQDGEKQSINPPKLKRKNSSVTA